MKEKRKGNLLERLKTQCIELGRTQSENKEVRNGILG